MALKLAGHEPVVYEAYPAGGDGIGAFLTIMHNGMDVEFVAPNGETVGRREFDTEGLDGPRTLTVSRWSADAAWWARRPARPGSQRSSPTAPPKRVTCWSARTACARSSGS